MRPTKSILLAVALTAVTAVTPLYAAAISEDLSAFSKENPQGYARLCSSIAAFYREKSDFTRALAWAERVLEVMPQNSEARFYKGQLLFSLRRWNDCEKALEGLEADIALKDSPSLVMIRGLLYQSYKESGKLAKKEKELESSLRGAAQAATKQSLDVYRQLFMMYRASESYDKTIELGKKAVKDYPEESSFKFALAYAYEKKGKIDEAVAGYKTIIQGQPANGNAYNLLFGMLKEKKRLKEAAELWREFVKKNPGNVILTFQLVDILYNMGRFDEAEGELNSIQQAYAGNPQVTAQVSGYRNWIAEARKKPAEDKEKNAAKEPKKESRKEPKKR